MSLYALSKQSILYKLCIFLNKRKIFSNTHLPTSVAAETQDAPSTSLVPHDKPHSTLQSALPSMRSSASHFIASRGLGWDEGWLNCTVGDPFIWKTFGKQREQQTAGSTLQCHQTRNEVACSFMELGAWLAFLSTHLSFISIIWVQAIGACNDLTFQWYINALCRLLKMGTLIFSSLKLLPSYNITLKLMHSLHLKHRLRAWDGHSPRVNTALACLHCCSYDREGSPDAS